MRATRAVRPGHTGGHHPGRFVAWLLATTLAIAVALVVGGSPASALTSQTITFGALSDETYGAAAFAISASGGGSGNPVTFSTSTGSVCSVTDNGNSTGSVSVVHSGTCTVLANQAGGGSYAAAPQVSRSFMIHQATLTVTAQPTNQTYGTTASLGATITGFQYSQTEAILTGSPNCTSAATASSGVSGNPYTITCTVGTMSDPTGNYVFTFVSGSLTVVPATLTVIANNQTITYGQPDPAFTFHTVGLVGSDTLTTTPTCGVGGGHTNAGTYSVTCSGANAGSNYAIAYQGGTLQINAATLAVAANDAGVTYGQPLPAFSFTATGFIGADGFTTAPTCGVSGTPTQVGTYPITCSGGDAGINYAISYQPGTLTIAQAGVTITANSQSITYGQNDPTFTFTVSGLKNGDSLTTSPTCLVSGDHRNAGTYPIVCSGANASGNYAYTYVSGALHVTPATLTITAENQTKVYGQADPQFSYQATGFVGADTLITGPACGVSAVHLHVSSYSITCSSADAGSNYTINYVPGTLVITTATLTVTADSAERVYGVPNAALTATFTGFQNGDTTANLTGSPSLGTTATTGSDPGRYPITVSQGTLASSDYTFTFQPGTLTIDEATVNVTGSTVSLGKSIIGGKVTMSATVTNAANGSPAVGVPTLFTAVSKTGKHFQCSGVTNSAGVASCTFHTGSPTALKNTLYTVQSQPTIDYLPGSGQGSFA